MTAFNVVRMKVKPGHEKEFLEGSLDVMQSEVQQLKDNGFRRFSVIKIGERTYCFIGEWDSFDSIVKSRPVMIQQLDRWRTILEDMGSGLGVTDPVSGEVAVEYQP